MGPAIHLEQASLTLNGVCIFPPMSGVFSAGQLHAITGGNGAGKSSLMKAMLGLVPHRGRIQRHWPQQAGHVAYVPQQTVFEAALPITVEEWLLSLISRRPFFLGRHKKHQQRLVELLAEVGLEEKRHLRLGQLSGGERQRLLFAQALERNSAFWCLDEPMTGLDEPAQQRITHRLRALRAQGATLLVIHHDTAWVEQEADTIWLIDRGLKLIKAPSSCKEGH